jgi:hypothetical protein
MLATRQENGRDFECHSGWMAAASMIGRHLSRLDARYVTDGAGTLADNTSAAIAMIGISARPVSVQLYAKYIVPRR